jgi:hypothetical protein
VCHTGVTLDARPADTERFFLPCGCPVSFLYPHNWTFALLHLVGAVSLLARLAQRYIHGLHKTETGATEARAIDGDVGYMLLSALSDETCIGVLYDKGHLDNP